jgi:hypothetical protein
VDFHWRLMNRYEALVKIGLRGIWNVESKRWLNDYNCYDFDSF